jgi:DNA polymerase-3 subunit epsilon
MILEKTLVVLDLEATGTWVEKDKIIEIGMIKIRPNGVEEEFNERIYPNMDIPDVVTEITGISNDDVKDKPTFKTMAPAIVEFIGDADLAGFNLERFDIPLLNRELNDAGYALEMEDRFIYDAQKIYHIHERRDLTSAYKFFCDKELDGAHSAIVDSRATLEIVKAQVDKYGKHDGVDSLQEFDYTRSSDFFGDDRKFRWWNGELYITFGKHNGKNVRLIAKEDRSYLEWILDKDFSDQVKSMIRGVIKGEFPRNGE